MDDRKDKDLLPWAEFQKLAWSGGIRESSEGFPFGKLISIRMSGIQCPTILPGGKKCQANLMDTEIVFDCIDEGRRIVVCPVCSTWRCRLLGA